MTEQAVSLELEVAELRLMVEKQRIMLNAIYGTTISLLDVFSQVLETRRVADRAEIANRLREIVGKARTETANGKSELSDFEIEAQTMSQKLLDAFSDQLSATPPPTPPPKPRLWVAVSNGDVN